jgi:DNA-directed RNA polymerase subunit M/transcription elongation factor TFIIS
MPPYNECPNCESRDTKWVSVHEHESGTRLVYEYKCESCQHVFIVDEESGGGE